MVFVHSSLSLCSDCAFIEILLSLHFSAYATDLDGARFFWLLACFPLLLAAIEHFAACRMASSTQCLCLNVCPVVRAAAVWVAIAQSLPRGPESVLAHLAAIISECLCENALDSASVSVA